MAEFEVGGHNYKTVRVDAVRQLHIARRLEPLLTAAPRAAFDGIGGDDPTMTLAGMQPILEALAKMEDEAVNYILENVLTNVERQEDGGRGWARVWTKGAGLQYTDISMIDMLTITANWVMAELGGFFPTSRSTST